MPRRFPLPFLLLIFVFQSSFGQFTPKILEAQRTAQTVTIDGTLTDPAWQDAARADEFVEYRPTIGKKEADENRTETFLIYSDDGIYFGGTCYEQGRDSIARELRGRDGFGNNDFIGIIFDTYHDELNGFEYFLTPLNEQWDAKLTPNDEDFSWNAVWRSAVVIHDEGWSFEMFIPYSAIRFGKDRIQDWGLNITRKRTNTGQRYTWSPIDPNVNGFMTQAGLWRGISNIKPPLRLQLTPYFSVYGNHFPASEPGQKDLTGQVAGGMDMKLGLSQAFTLDATLIPDFGQVQSDNQVLNLSPFEVKFNENRAFFNEGTELFGKGNLFYSRRIGGAPLRRGNAADELGENEQLKKNPSVSKLVNATKVSGRTQGGLGVGLLNALTKKQFATIENTETGEIRRVETDPMTNYNIVVLDQTLKNNSSVSFINTSVIRGGKDYNANVSAALFSLFDRNNTYNTYGQFSLSHLKYKTGNADNLNGYSHEIGFGKTSGNFTFRIEQELTDTKFTSNDLGFFTNNNYIDYDLDVDYRVTEPKGWYNRFHFSLDGGYSSLFSPISDIKTKYQRSSIGLRANVQTKKLQWMGIFANYSPGQNDFYEPRVEGLYFRRGGYVSGGGWFESNDARQYSVEVELYGRAYQNFYNLYNYETRLEQNFRFNSRFSVRHSINLEVRPRNLGYMASADDGSPVFALRHIKTFNNVLNLKYSFTNRMGLTFRARHYSSVVDAREYFSVNKNGTLSLRKNYLENLDRNVNFFNIDMVYTWQFAPGSFLNIVWKNATVNTSDLVGTGYFENLQDTLQSDQNNNISLKIIYFLDYLTVKRMLRKSKES
ncbi:DUF5916 domain-containing protein [Persicitalea jodogahamensis]|uniref:DUF5916 domain-containing protein n=1 Tax=Persicitalea jodogahamensis TaxID=402147 RepID=A0A8J3GA69_9BACT|nr:DUF5916 domain-containing protein [Persicitalea jodogahamensis]GHB70412.1 hypothetical protein GCM10007390_25080 [Persicitalea jodogahamensis]